MEVQFIIEVSHAAFAVMSLASWVMPNFFTEAIRAAMTAVNWFLSRESNMMDSSSTGPCL